jgi:hypothetical protein
MNRYFTTRVYNLSPLMISGEFHTQFELGKGMSNMVALASVGERHGIMEQCSDCANNVRGVCQHDQGPRYFLTNACTHRQITRELLPTTKRMINWHKKLA